MGSEAACLPQPAPTTTAAAINNTGQRRAILERNDWLMAAVSLQMRMCGFGPGF
jgi:hypothetical protein